MNRKTNLFHRQENRSEYLWLLSSVFVVLQLDHPSRSRMNNKMVILTLEWSLDCCFFHLFIIRSVDNDDNKFTNRCRDTPWWRTHKNMAAQSIAADLHLWMNQRQRSLMHRFKKSSWLFLTTIVTKSLVIRFFKWWLLWKDYCVAVLQYSSLEVHLNDEPTFDISIATLLTTRTNWNQIFVCY